MAGSISMVHATDITTQEQDVRIAVQTGGYFAFTNSGAVILSQPLAVTVDTILDAGPFAVTLSGGNVSRAMEIRPGVSLTLLNITISDGHATNGGGIFNEGGSVRAVGCTFTSNTAQGMNGAEAGVSGEAAAGGAIYSSGNLVVLDSTFQDNRALGGHGAVGMPGATTNVAVTGGPGGDGGAAFGGALFADGRAVVSNCVFAGNSVAGGIGGSGGRGGRNMASRNTKGGTGGIGGGGGEVSGGAVRVFGTALFNAVTCMSNSCVGGAGGFGGAGGTDRSASYASHGGDSGPAGPGGNASGAGIAIGGGDVQVKLSQFLGNQLAGGSGGPGRTSPFMFEGLNGRGGGGGSAGGAALHIAGARTIVERCSFANNYGRGGQGGAGANSHLYGVMFYPDDAGSGASAGSARGTLFNQGVLTLAGCTFSSNLLHGGMGGAGGHGGRPNGGRIGSDGGAAGSGGDAFGGAVCQIQQATLFNCTIVGNECRGGDGGPGGHGGMIAHRPNSLFGGNGGAGGTAAGGGIWTGPDAKTTVDSLTIAGNNVSAGAGARGGSGDPGNPWQDPDGEDGTNGVARGANLDATGSLRIRNSVLIGSTTNGQAFGDIRDRGHNLCSDKDCGFGNNTSLNDADAMLGSLADNGGATLTMLPHERSPAIDAAARNRSAVLDQRGSIRARGSRPDIGAVEAGSIQGITIRGRVLNDGDGVPGVVVRLGSRRAVTDAEGVYEFVGVEPRRYRVRPVAQGQTFNPSTRLVRVSHDSWLDDFVARPRK
jgi:hypothetical protein